MYYLGQEVKIPHSFIVHDISFHINVGGPMDMVWLTIHSTSSCISPKAPQLPPLFSGLHRAYLLKNPGRLRKQFTRLDEVLSFHWRTLATLSLFKESKVIPTLFAKRLS